VQLYLPSLAEGVMRSSRPLPAVANPQVPSLVVADGLGANTGPHNSASTFEDLTGTILRP